MNLEFDDVSDMSHPPAIPISDDQAKAILKFGEEHKDYNLLIHCTAGKSRSAAVAQGLMDCFPEVWELHEESNRILTPNPEVLRLLHRYGLYENS